MVVTAKPRPEEYSRRAAAQVELTDKKRGEDNSLKIDVIIPVYRPDEELFSLLDRLKEQTFSIHKIILMNTERRYFEELLRKTGRDLAGDYGNVEVHHLSKSDFDHGGTRHKALRYSDAEIFVFMTQDAMPADKYVIERLTAHLRSGLARKSHEEAAADGGGIPGAGSPEDEIRVAADGGIPGAGSSEDEIRVAAAYGRQLPGAGCSETERISRYFNYPGKSRIKTKADLPAMGIKTYFCSNVCAAYRRDIYEESGGFVRHTIFNEDMIYAAGVIKAGYGIAYEAEARVVHSHDYTNMQQLRRNFDLGVSQAEHPEVFAGVPSEREGKRLVREAYGYLRSRKKLYRFPGFCIQCGFKYTGYLLGKHYRKLPKKWILLFTASKEYWK